MSILCCRRNRQPPAGQPGNPQVDAIALPTLPPRVRLSQTTSRLSPNMYPPSTVASRRPSQLVHSTYHSIVDPESVDVDDSDDDRPGRDTKGISTSALGSLKTKFIRRLSHRVDAKTGSHPCAGPSDEELARRAELKRLMHKRIQEELKSEEEQEDLRVAPGQPSIGHHAESELPGGGPRDTIEFSVSGIDEKEAEKEAREGHGKFFDPQTQFPQGELADGSQVICGQQTSSSEPDKSSVENYYHDCNVSDNGDKLDIQPPSLVRPTPVHICGRNGRESSPTSSWRLSYSTIHIDSYLEPLVEARQVANSQPSELDSSSKQCTEASNAHTLEADTTTDPSNPVIQQESKGINQTMPIEHESNCTDKDISSISYETSNGRCSPLSVWLRSQGLHHASMLADRPDSEVALQPHEITVIEQVDNEQNSGGKTKPTRHDGQATSLTSSFQENGTQSWETLPRHDAGGENSVVTPSSESLALHQILSQMENAFPEAEIRAQSPAPDVSSRYGSSQFTTMPISQKATPRGSRLSLAEFMGSRGLLRPLKPTYGTVSSCHVPMATNRSDIILPGVNPSSRSSSDRLRPLAETSQLPIAGTPSTTASETASFRQREEELISIERRFMLASACRRPTTPILSRFREEFDDPREMNGRRSSLLSLLHLTVPKRDGWLSPHMELRKSKEDAKTPSFSIPIQNQSLSSGLCSNKNQHLLSHKLFGELAEGDMKASCQPTAKKEADYGTAGSKAELVEVSMSKVDINDAQEKPIPIPNRRPAITKTRSMDGARKILGKSLFPITKTPDHMANLVETRGHNSVDIHAGVLQEWVEQLQAENIQRQSRKESRINTPRGQPLRFRTPPESWAKWPSHTRKERTTLAGEMDKVKSWDFAVDKNSKNLETRVRERPISRTMESTTSSRTFSGQISKALKAGWNKMMTQTGSLGRLSDRRRPLIPETLEPHGFLEYQELELLPTAEGYKEVQALDQQIDTMKRRSTSRRDAMQQSSGESTRPALAARIVEEVHKVRAKSQDTSWADTQIYTNGSRTTQHLSPTHISLTRRPRSCDPELLSTTGLQSSKDAAADRNISISAEPREN